MSQFKDLLVVEFASVLAGPAVGQFFAELGATVIKVENLKTAGDVTRSWKIGNEITDDRSAYFCAVNWGKQSIAIDLSDPRGRRVAEDLAAKADIVVASYKPGDARKLGVDYETLSKNHPGLIYGQITGYGSHNPRVGYDAVIQAEAGFMSMNGEPGGRPLKMPVALMDVLAAHHLKEGLLLAMLEKQHTGAGKLVEVSLIEAAVSSLANQATNYLVAGKIPGKQGSEHPNIAPYGDVFTTADGAEIMLAVGTDKQFESLCNILKISRISKNSAFTTNALRVRNRRALRPLLEDAMARQTASELLPVLHAAVVPAALIRDVKKALEDPDVQRLLLSGGGLAGIRSFAGRGASISPHLTPPPRLGEHSLYVLQEMLKISPNEASDLIKAGIIR